MKLRNKIILIVFSIILLIGLVHQFNKYQFENYKTNLISELEHYKNKYGTYPADLKKLKLKDHKSLYYSYDSIENSYQLAYPTGFGLNTTFYDSKTKTWKEKFNF